MRICHLKIQNQFLIEVSHKHQNVCRHLLRNVQSQRQPGSYRQTIMRNHNYQVMQLSSMTTTNEST